MKRWSLLDKSDNRLMSLGMLAGIAVLLLCFCAGIIAAVTGSSVYSAAFKRGCVSPELNIDSDAYAVYYSSLQKFADTNDIQVLKDAEFRCGGQTEAIFDQNDIKLLAAAGNTFLGIKITAAVLLVLLAAGVVAVWIKRGRSTLAVIASWAGITFACALAACLAAIGLTALEGGSFSDGLYRLLTFDAIFDYTGGNLSLLYGRITMDTVTTAAYCMSGFFAVIAAILLAVFSRIDRRTPDLLDDYMYQ